MISSPTITPTITAEMADSAQGKLWIRVGWGLVTVGWVLAVTRYGQRLGLRYDEARVVLNLLDRSYAGLLQPLDYEQGAPVGFLWIHKAMVDWVSFSEWGLRLPTLVAGLISIWMVWSSACKLAGSCVGAVTILVFLGHPLFGIYVPEVKQYAFDVAATATLLWVWAFLPSGSMSGRTVGGLVVMGMLAPWFSHASLFVLSGFGLALLWRSIATEAGRREVAKLVLMGGTWGASFATLYVLQLQELAGEKWTLQWWGNYFAPFPPTSMREVSWYMTAWGEYLNSFHWGWLFGPCWLAGTWRLGRENQAAWALFMLPGLVALGVSAHEAYPFHGRLLLFALPLVSLPLARGILWCWDHPLRQDIIRRMVRVLIVLGLLYWGGVGGVRRVSDHNNAINSRPLFERVSAEFRKGDVVWLEGEMDYPRQVYGQLLDLDISKWVQGDAWSHSRMDEVNAELKRIDAPRIWVITTVPRDRSIWPLQVASEVGFERPGRTVIWTRSSALYLLE
jgi:hypothetical protein